MSGTLLPNGRTQFIDANGSPVVNGYVYTYVPSTTTPKATWQDYGETILNTNPIRLDSLGSAVIWGTGLYREIVADAGNITLPGWDVVSLAPALGAGGQAVFFDTIADLQAASIGSDVNTVYVSGYATVGVGAMQLTRSTGPSAVGKYQSADGTYWLYVIPPEGANVESFGAVADYNGSSGTNNTTAFQNTINFIASQPKGGDVVIPAGRFYLATGIASTANYVRIRGAGKRITYLYYGQTTGAFLRIGDSGAVSNPQFWDVSGISFGATTQMVSGSMIEIDNGYNINIHDFTLDANLFWGVACVSGSNQYNYKITNFDIYSGQVGIIAGFNGVIQELYIEDCNIGPCTAAAIQLLNVSGFHFCNINILTCFIGVLITAQNFYVRAGTMDDVVCDTGTSHGFKFTTDGVSGGDLAYVADIRMSNCWASNNGVGDTTVHGFYFVPKPTGNGFISGITMVNCISRGNGGDGILLEKQIGTATMSQVHIMNPMLFSNGKNGFESAFGQGDFSLIGGFAGSGGDSGTGNAGYGAIVDAGAADRYVIQGMNLIGNTLGSLSDGGTGVNKIVGPNITSPATSTLTGTATYDPPSLADGAGTTTTVTVTGAALGNTTVASFSLDLQGITLTAYVSAANTVSVRFQNESGGVLDLASGTLTAKVFR